MKESKELKKWKKTKTEKTGQVYEDKRRRQGEEGRK